MGPDRIGMGQIQTEEILEHFFPINCFIFARDFSACFLSQGNDKTFVEKVLIFTCLELLAQKNGRKCDLYANV